MAKSETRTQFSDVVAVIGSNVAADAQDTHLDGRFLWTLHCVGIREGSLESCAEGDPREAHLQARARQ